MIPKLYSCCFHGMPTLFQNSILLHFKENMSLFHELENNYFEGKGGYFLVSDWTLKSTDNGVFMFIWFTAKINIEDNNIFLCSTEVNITRVKEILLSQSFRILNFK